MDQAAPSTPEAASAFVLLTDRAGHSAILRLDEAFDALIAPPLAATLRQTVAARHTAPLVKAVAQWVVGNALAHVPGSHDRVAYRS